MPCIDPFQSHADNISALASYFDCCFCWSLSGHHGLCRCQILLFCLRVLLFQTFFFLYFSLSMPVYIELTSIMLVICSCFFCVDYIFFVTLIFSFSSCQFRLSRILGFIFLFILILSLSSCWFRELSWICFVFVELEIKQFLLVTLSYQPYFNPRSTSYVVYKLTIRTQS